MRTKNGNEGFTLMEMLVVLGMFSMVVVTATDIFLLASRAQRKVFGLERIQADARYAMEAIVREVRGGTIDLGYYAGRAAPLAAPDTELALVDAQNGKVRFSLSEESEEALCPDAASAPCLLVRINDGTPAPMTPKGTRVRAASFYVSPAADPFAFDPGTGTYAADEQPRVTVALVLETVGERDGESSVVTLQTTAVSRKYAR